MTSAGAWPRAASRSFPPRFRTTSIGVTDEPARVLGVFGANTIVSVFDDSWVPYGTRVLGTPPPAEALAAA